MSFLAPIFLFGLAAVSIPVLIHLRRRKSRQRVAFPSLMFLDQVPHATIKRRRLRDLLLLALRAAAMILLALAFAQPAVRVGALSGATQAKTLVLVVDRSASLLIGDRWQRSQTAAQEALGGLAADDRVTLVLYDEEVEVPISRDSDTPSVQRFLESIQPRPRRTSLPAALRVVRPMLIDLMEEGEGGAVEVVLISDFPAAGTTDLEDLRLPPGATLRLVDVGEPVSNHWVQGVELQQVGGDLDSRREQVRVVATLGRDSSSSASAWSEVSVSLWIDGRQVEERTPDSDGSLAAVTFAPLVLDPDRPSRGEIRSTPDVFPLDDIYYFTATAADSIPVLVTSSTRGDAGLYVVEALASSHAPRFRVERAPADGGAIDPGQFQVVIVPDAGELGVLGDRLRSYTLAGGGVLLGLGPRSANQSLPAWLGLTTPEVTQSRMGLRLASVDRAHPAFVGVDQQDLSSAPFFRTASLSPSVLQSSGSSLLTDQASLPALDSISSAQAGTSAGRHRILARFDDGSAALIEETLGAGRVMVFGSSLDTAWNDFPRQALYIAWIDRIVRSLAGFEPQREQFTLGQPALIELSKTNPDQWVLVSPSGSAKTVTAREKEDDGPADSELLLVFDQPGHSSVRPAGSDLSQARWLAANLDRAESDLARADVDLLAARLEPSLEVEQSVRAGVSIPKPPTSFWWLLLYGMLLLLSSEVYVAQRARALSSLPIPPSPPTARLNRTDP